jgi:aldehyde:ferredoxin oxidoreductase
MDTISCGAVVALAMDLTEQGVKDFGLRFGEAEGYLKAPKLIARREGIGAELALGTRALAAKYGHPELSFEVKNLELPGYDPRGSFGMSLSYATSDRGGCHMRSYTVGPEILEGSAAPDSIEGKAAMNIEYQDFTSILYAGIWCGNYAQDLDQVGHVLEQVWRRPFGDAELMKVGERIWNLGRLFNLREGVEPDDLPIKLYAEEHAHTEGVSAGRAIGTEAFRTATREYYTLRGWDENGVPGEEKLAELGVDVRL